ncbi:MAG: phosphoribosyltransferase [bacterium]
MQDPNLLKDTLKKYKKDNYHVQSWSEYEPELKTLTDKVLGYVKDNKLTIDAVVPILRGGNIPATFLAYALDVLTILPVQYKYFFTPGKCQLRRLLSIDPQSLPVKNPTILLIEGNHCYGNQAKYAAQDLRQAFPNSRIIYGASNMDYKYQDVVVDAEVSFYGNLTNCCKELTDSQCKELGIVNGYKSELLFPWENIDEEWDIVALKQHHYSNLKELQIKSPLVAEYPL